jgi:hypothetical protein
VGFTQVLFGSNGRSKPQKADEFRVLSAFFNVYNRQSKILKNEIYLSNEICAKHSVMIHAAQIEVSVG